MSQTRKQQREGNPSDLTLHLGHEQLVIRRRYQALSILNDFLLGVLFLVGSVFFLFPSLYVAGTWLFIVASVLFVARPMIRLAHYFHLSRTPTSEWDF